MKVLVMSNMRPSVQQPFSGIWVVNQFHELQKLLGKSQVDLYAMERIFTSKIGSVWKYFKSFIGFTPFLFKKYDLLHVHFFFPFIFLANLYRFFHPRTKIVVTFHGSDISIHMNNFFNRKFFGSLVRKADYTIAVGNEIAKETEQKLKFYPNLVMCAGVDKSVFYPEPGAKKKYDFIFVGSFILIKGIDILIEAIRLLNRKDVRFCIAGRGPFKEELEKLASEYAIVIMEKQSQEELRHLCSQSKFMILPSRSESFGLVVTEAMYCGTPALVSFIGGLKDQVQENVNGFYLYELDAVKLKELMERALSLTDSAYDVMSENAKKSNEHFSLDFVMKKTIEIYSGLTGIKPA